MSARLEQPTLKRTPTLAEHEVSIRLTIASREVQRFLHPLPYVLIVGDRVANSADDTVGSQMVTSCTDAPTLCTMLVGSMVQFVAINAPEVREELVATIQSSLRDGLESLGAIGTRQ